MMTLNGLIVGAYTLLYSTLLYARCTKKRAVCLTKVK